MTPAAQNDQRVLGRPRPAVISRSPLPAITRPQLALVALLALAGSLAMLWLQPWNVTLSDWGTESRVPLNALLHGHVIGFLELAPPYGPSLVMRAPFALLASLAGGSARLVYRFSALPCLLALAGLALGPLPQPFSRGRIHRVGHVALEVVGAFGIGFCILLVATVYWLGIRGMQSVSHTYPTRELGMRFIHTIIPIAFGYLVAHYFSLLVTQGQATASLISNPLGTNSNLFGTPTSRSTGD